MAKETKIEWCDHTFSPWRGCTKVSAGCANCYAETQSHRNPKALGVWGDDGIRVIAAESAWREVERWNRKAGRDGVRRRVFCGSMCDVCEDRPELVEPRDRLRGLIDVTTHLDWLLLSKRPENYFEMFGDPWDHDWPSNVWAGTSIENQETADNRIPELVTIPAMVRFLSCEPLLGPIDPRRAGIGWVIIGGESGPKARPCNVEWIRSIVQQCKTAGVPCFVKQDSGNRPGLQGRITDNIWQHKEFPNGQR